MFADDSSPLKTDELMKSKYGKMENVHYLSLIGALCNQDCCIAKVDDQNTPLVWDYVHLALQMIYFYCLKHLIQNNASKFLFKQ